MLLIPFVVCRSDVAYYDGLSETILSVELVEPKPGSFYKPCLHAPPTCFHAVFSILKQKNNSLIRLLYAGT